MMTPTLFRILTLATALAAPAAQACAVAEGCPMGEPRPVGGCAIVRIDADHVCIDDPTAPGGVRIVPVGGTVPEDAPDCAPSAKGGCLMPLPERPTDGGQQPDGALRGSLPSPGVAPTR